MKKLNPSILLALALSCGAFSAQGAEDPATQPASILADLSTSVTVGYDSRYVLYGYRLSRHLYHADVFWYLPINDTVSAWAGAWYGYLTDGTYNELDGYGGLDFYINEHLNAGVGYSIFNYLEVPYPTSAEAHELMARVTAVQGPFSLTLKSQYDSEAEGALFRALLDYNASITEKISITASAEVGYGVEYFFEGDAWNHALYTLRLPIQLTEKLSASPFIAYTDPLDAIDSFEKSETYGGLWFTATF